MAFWRTSGISVSGATSPGLSRASCLNATSMLEWVALCLSCTSRRWGSRKVATCLLPFSALRLTILLKMSWRVQIALCSWLTLCVSGKTLNRVERAMHLCIHSVQEWVSENGFKFSTSKTVCIHFHQQYIFFPGPNILLGKTPIKVAKEAKFLGLIFDTELTFKNHVQYLKSSCQKALHILCVVGHIDWGADCIVLLHLYRVLVRSKLDYESIVYGSACQLVLKQLDLIHHQGLCIALGAFRISPAQILYVEAHEPSLTSCYLKLSLNFVLKLKSLPENPADSCV